MRGHLVTNRVKYTLFIDSRQSDLHRAVPSLPTLKFTHKPNFLVYIATPMFAIVVSLIKEAGMGGEGKRNWLGFYRRCDDPIGLKLGQGVVNS